MKHLNELMTNRSIFFNFMREKYKVYNNSNIFFRDIQYAIKSYLEKKEKKVKYSDAENLAKEFIKKLETEGQLIKMSNNAWKVNFSFESVVTKETTENVTAN